MVIQMQNNGQTRKKSLLESFVNVLSGFVIASIAWRFIIAPLFNIEHSWGKNMAITLIFSVISITRGYCVRRVFNMIDRNIHKEAR